MFLFAFSILIIRKGFHNHPEVFLHNLLIILVAHILHMGRCVDKSVHIWACMFTVYESVSSALAATLQDNKERVSSPGHLANPSPFFTPLEKLIALISSPDRRELLKSI